MCKPSSSLRKGFTTEFPTAALVSKANRKMATCPANSSNRHERRLLCRQEYLREEPFSTHGSKEVMSPPNCTAVLIPVDVAWIWEQAIKE